MAVSTTQLEKILSNQFVVLVYIQPVHLHLSMGLWKYRPNYQVIKNCICSLNMLISLWRIISAGNWLWPALWLIPQKSKYGNWPRSGEIDIMESRGNRPVDAFGSTLHFGPSWDHDAWSTATFNKHSQAHLDQQFHKYKLEWNTQHIKFFLDNQFVGEIPVNRGFWDRGHFQGDYIWKHGTPMAPFDDEVGR